MIDLRELLKQAADGPAPPSPLAAGEVYSAGRRQFRRRRRIVMGGAVAALALAVIAATATTVVTARPGPAELPADRGTSAVRQSPRPGVTGAGAIIQWAGAADAKHLYLVYLNCGGQSCPKDAYDLVGSDDGGDTWSTRATGMAAHDWRVVGPHTLLATAYAPTVHPVVSMDGGRSWSDLVRAAPRATVASGGMVICWPADGRAPCRLYAVDLTAGWFALLAAQPSVKPSETASIDDVGGRLWVTGVDPVTGRPAVAVSSDRGRTWSTKVFVDLTDCAAQRCGAPELATADGSTVYVMAADSVSQKRIVYRRTEDGIWQRLNTTNLPYGRGLGWSFVASDGSHVLCDMGESRPGDLDVDQCQFWASKDAATYQRVQLAGLPTAVQDVRRAPDGWFYTFSYAPTSTLYGSPDGWHWSPVTE
jgi:hypothetical protein